MLVYIRVWVGARFRASLRDEEDTWWVLCRRRRPGERPGEGLGRRRRRRAPNRRWQKEKATRERERARGGPTAEGIRNQVVPRTNAQIDLLRAWGSGKGTRPARRLWPANAMRKTERRERRGKGRGGLFVCFDTAQEGAPKVLSPFPRFVLEVLIWQNACSIFC